MDLLKTWLECSDFRLYHIKFPIAVARGNTARTPTFAIRTVPRDELRPNLLGWDVFMRRHAELTIRPCLDDILSMFRLNQSFVDCVHFKPQLPVGTPSTPWLGVPHGTKSRRFFVEDFYELIKPSIQLSAGTTRSYDGHNVVMSGDRLMKRLKSQADNTASPLSNHKVR